MRREAGYAPGAGSGVKKLLRILGKRHQTDIEALSAYLDGRLEASRASAVIAHVAACETCRTVLEGMRSTRAMLRAMPSVDAPRSFRLRQADVEAAPRVPARTSPMLRWSPVAAGVAAAVFVVVLGADLATRDSGGGASLASRQADERTGMIQDDATFSQEASKGAPTGAGQSDDFDGSGGAIRPPDTGTSIAAGSGPAADASTEVPLTAAPTPNATEAPVEAMIPADTSSAPNTAPEPAGSTAPDAGADAAAPTGPPPDGDASVPAPGAAAPELATQPAGAIPPGASRTEAPASRVDVRPSATAVGEITALADESENDDGGNRTGFFIVEIAAAVAAVASGVTFVAWRTRRRGTA